MIKTKKENIKYCQEKIFNTIISCKTEDHYKSAENLIINFYNNICNDKKIVYFLLEFLQRERFLKNKFK